MGGWKGSPRGQTTFHWPEFGHLVTSNCKGVWEMSSCELGKKSQNALSPGSQSLAQCSVVNLGKSLLAPQRPASMW